MAGAGSRGRSRGELIRERTRARFVGRQAQVSLFSENLAKDPASSQDPADFLFHVRGVGGVGKSTLLRQWQEAARRAGALTAVVDEGDAHGRRAAGPGGAGPAAGRTGGPAQGVRQGGGAVPQGPGGRRRGAAPGGGRGRGPGRRLDVEPGRGAGGARRGVVPARGGRGHVDGEPGRGRAGPRPAARGGAGPGPPGPGRGRVGHEPGVRRGAGPVVRTAPVGGVVLRHVGTDRRPPGRMAARPA
ncbi:ATP-binding protein [Streptomyces sp. PmtG]